jgi:hypothetical protein
MLKQELRNLYEQDFVEWLSQTLSLLKTKNLDSLDWEHLIEEIESLGNEQRHKVNSYLFQLLVYLLLYRYWKGEREWSGRSWAAEIDNFRTQLEFLFESKTLHNYFLERVEIVYPKAVRQASFKSQLPRSIFPEQCPFSTEEILNDKFFPD